MLFSPNRFIPGPRPVELIIQSILFLVVIWVVSSINIDIVLFGQSFIGKSPISSSIFTLILFMLYKLASTTTAVDKLEICNNERLIKIEYFLFHVFKRNVAIKFEDFLFYYREDLLFFGASTGIRIYSKNKFKVKLNARNGWKKEQIEQIIQEFLIITDGKTRKKSFL
jgi:hypothetical protein